jgi:hypothetical protein
MSEEKVKHYRGDLIGVQISKEFIVLTTDPAVFDKCQYARLAIPQVRCDSDADPSIDNWDSRHLHYYYPTLKGLVDDPERPWKVLRWEMYYDGFLDFEEALSNHVEIQDIRSWIADEDHMKGAAVLSGLLNLPKDTAATVYWENWLKAQTLGDITEWLEAYFERVDLKLPISKFYPPRYDGSLIATRYFVRYCRGLMRSLLTAWKTRDLEERPVQRIEARFHRLLQTQMTMDKDQNSQLLKSLYEAIWQAYEEMGIFAPVYPEYVVNTANALDLWANYKYKAKDL